MSSPVDHATSAAGRLVGKVAIVTGAASGIGLATAIRFAAEGAAVAAADIVGLPSDLPPGVSPVSLDVSDEAAWRRAVTDLLARHGRIDILVNNAGIGGPAADVASLDLVAWNRTLDVNLTGVALGMQAVIPAMRAQGGGSIINISSIWGIAAVPAGAAYQASKGAVRMLSKHAAVAYARDAIRVNSVHPGIVRTPMVLNQQPESASRAIVAATPLGRMAEPVEIAHACLFLASDEASFVTGTELVIDGGYLAQ